ncbi:C-type lectin domain family 4 member E-like isoform 4-T4 [Vipera latastei]
MEDQMKVFGSNLDHSERNYQNVVPPNRTRAMKSKSVIPQCPKGWLKFQTNCYYFSADQQPWEKAMSNCQSLNAHLVVTDDKNDTDKQEFLDHLKNSSYWIGLRRHPKDKWMWINGKPFPEATQSIENNKKEDCMYNLWKDSKSRKKKTACTEYFPYICEKEQT